jgi:NADPH-dependent glutamate synthase beta subunit-like oxidoreductase
MGADPDPARPLVWSEPGRTTRETRTGGWRVRRPLYAEATAPCRAACPAGEPIARWIERARAGDLAGAWALIREANPFPAVTGRVCGHPCEAACNRAGQDGSVAINALERFVGDWGLRHGPEAPAPRPRPGRVAVVGGGPAGLACAHHLARAGFGVTLFEAQPALGGLLRYGIPEYRLPRAVLEGEIELALAPGVRVETGRQLGRDLTWADLEGWDAVFLATGAAVPLRLGVPGEDGSAIGDALTLLRVVSRGYAPALGRRVLVVGGGSTAMDAARTARRLGSASVTVLALEAREAMPALAEEVAQALAEGVRILNGVGVREFGRGRAAEGAALVEPARLERGPGGAIRPVFDGGPSVRLDADAVLVAIGQRPDLGVIPPPVGAEGGGVAAGPDGSTSSARVFAGGDVASRRRTVAEAIAAGVRAARAIEARLTGRAAGDEALPTRVVGPGEIRRHAFSPFPRAARWERLAPGRLASFIEVVTGLDEGSARAEAARCYACGHCTGCDVCRQVCPDVAIARVDGGYRVSADHCKGCGLCARECPRGALAMAAER